MAAMCFPKLEVFITRLQTGTLQNLVCKQTSAFSNITSPSTKLELDLQRCTCHCKNQYDGHNSYGAHLILIQFGKPIHTHSPWGDEINVRKLILLFLIFVTVRWALHAVIRVHTDDIQYIYT